MTKYAIISDIHANMDALNLVLKDSEKRNVNKIICLGDLVNKYFKPVEVVDAIRSESDIVIKGNHDYNVTHNENFKWVRSKLGIDRLDYLDNLPVKEKIMINQVLVNLYHATPNSLTEMFNPTFKQSDYAGGIEKNPSNMFIGDAPQISFTGHTHKEFIAVDKGENGLYIPDTKSIILTGQDKAIVNVGAVGENCQLSLDDNNKVVTKIEPYVTYVIVDDSLGKDKIKVDVIHIPYKETLKKIYFDRLQMESNKEAPLAPNDDEKIKESLVDMGYTESEIKGR